MRRKVGWFSCGAASAVACKIAEVDVWAYCDTRAEHKDNRRFMKDIERAWGVEVVILHNDDYDDTWDVWDKRKYLSGVNGAPCTLELKVKPRLKFQRPDDVHIFGYTADGADRRRYESLVEHYPEITTRAPLIEEGLTKAQCRGILEALGIKDALTYDLGFPNANCIPCVKAVSPNYWALVRKYFPEAFWRMAKKSRAMNVKLTRIHGERRFIDEIPEDWPTTDPIVPDCDFLCQLHQDDISKGVQRAG